MLVPALAVGAGLSICYFGTGQYPIIRASQFSSLRESYSEFLISRRVSSLGRTNSKLETCLVLMMLSTRSNISESLRVARSERSAEKVRFRRSVSTMFLLISNPWALKAVRIFWIAPFSNLPTITHRKVSPRCVPAEWEGVRGDRRLLPLGFTTREPEEELSKIDGSVSNLKTHQISIIFILHGRY